MAVSPAKGEKVARVGEEHKPSISIVIPAYNEVGRIERALESLLSYLGDRNDVEIIVVMDGCTDGSPKIVARYAKRDARIVPLIFSRRLGKGGALLKGFEAARGDVLVTCDADMPTKPEELFRLASMVDGYDLIIGSRYVKGAKLVRKPGPIRLFLSRAFNVFVRLLFKDLRHLRDTQCGIKVIKKELTKTVKRGLIITGLAFDVNLLYLAIKMGARIKEIGVWWNHREYKSKVSMEIMKVIPRMALALLKLKIRIRRLPLHVLRQRQGFSNALL